MHKVWKSHRVVSVATSFALTLSLTIFSAQTSSASQCQPVKPSGKTVGEISVGSTSMAIKSFNYPKGGVMEPQATTLAAGLSARHMPLSSNVGSSIIVWHRDYNNCVHPLNLFFNKDKGSTFKLTDENGETKNYRITKTGVITKGAYKKSWFNLIGQRQIVLFTCTGVFKSGHYEKNLVVFASPAE